MNLQTTKTTPKKKYFYERHIANENNDKNEAFGVTLVCRVEDPFNEDLEDTNFEKPRYNYFSENPDNTKFSTAGISKLSTHFGTSSKIKIQK